MGNTVIMKMKREYHRVRKQKPLITKKSGKKPNSNDKKEACKPLQENKISAKEHSRLKGLVSDLSKTRNNMEKKIKKQAHELKGKNGQLRKGGEKQIIAKEQIYIRTKAMEATVDGIFIIDAQKKKYPVIYANKSFKEMTGYEKKEIIGRNYFLFYGDKYNCRTIDEIKHTISWGKVFHGELLSVRKNGRKYC